VRTKDRYARLAGRFWRHPKAMACGDAALALWTRALSYVVDQMTDGHVSRAVASQLSKGKPDKAAAELVALGLWETHSTDGWLFHDYAEHNITKEKWEGEAARNRAKTDASRQRVTGNTDPPVTGNVPGNSQTQDARRKTQDVLRERETRARDATLATAPTEHRPGELENRVRSSVAEALRSAGRPAPPLDTSSKCQRIADWCNDHANATGRPVEDVIDTLARGFASAAGKTAKAGWPLGYLAQNPGEYIRLAPSNPMLGGGETDEELLADLRRTA